MRTQNEYVCVCVFFGEKYYSLQNLQERKKKKSGKEMGSRKEEVRMRKREVEQKIKIKIKKKKDDKAGAWLRKRHTHRPQAVSGREQKGGDSGLSLRLLRKMSSRHCLDIYSILVGSFLETPLQHPMCSAERIRLFNKDRAPKYWTKFRQG